MFSTSPPWRSSGKKTDKKQSDPKFSSGRIFALYSDKNQKCPKLVIYKIPCPGTTPGQEILLFTSNYRSPANHSNSNAPV